VATGGQLASYSGAPPVLPAASAPGAWSPGPARAADGAGTSRRSQAKR